jgi:hypothetical protein
MSSPGPAPREDSRLAVAAPGPGLAYTAKQAAKIIGGTCKASWLKAKSRAGEFPCTMIGGAYNYTDADITEIVALCQVPARTKQAAATPAPARRASARRTAAAQPGTLPFPPAEVIQIRAREPRKRGAA